MTGKAKSVLRSLGVNYTIDNVLHILVQEYKEEASSDLIFQEFYQLKQQKGEKVQVFSVWNA